MYPFSDCQAVQNDGAVLKDQDFHLLLVHNRMAQNPSTGILRQEIVLALQLLFR
jgi:hypothetical protein